jgi:hypothetical protein
LEGIFHQCQKIFYHFWFSIFGRPNPSMIFGALSFKVFSG